MRDRVRHVVEVVKAADKVVAMMSWPRLAESRMAGRCYHRATVRPEHGRTVARCRNAYNLLRDLNASTAHGKTSLRNVKTRKMGNCGGWVRSWSFVQWMRFTLVRKQVAPGMVGTAISLHLNALQDTLCIILQYVYS